MSLCTFEKTMDRIVTATTESPVAVFSTGEQYRFDVVFANTVSGMQRVALDWRLVGVFHQGMDPRKIRDQIRGDRPGPGSLRCPGGPVYLTRPTTRQIDPMLE